VQAAEGAAETVLVQWEGGLGEVQRHLLLAGSIFLDLELPGGDAGHQRLAVGQRHVEGTVRCFLDANAGVLAELLDQILAVVAQGRSVTPGRLHLANLRIEFGDVAGQPIDLAGRGHPLALERIELGADIAVQAIEALRQLLRLADDLLAQGNGLGRGTGFTESGEKVVQTVAAAGAFAVDQAFQRGQVLLIGAEVSLVGAGTPQLLVVKVAGQPADAGHLNTTADTGRGLPAERMLLGCQPTEAGCVDVSDVLPGRRQGDLRGANAAVANLTKNTHDTTSFGSIRIGCAKATERWPAPTRLRCWLGRATASVTELSGGWTCAHGSPALGAVACRSLRMLRV